MGSQVNRQIHLRKRPEGMPKESDFELVETLVPEPAPGQILVRNIFMSVDPYMRGRMVDRKSYVEPFQIDRPLDGACVGWVVESKSEQFQVGDHVSGMQGWREYYVSDGTGLMKIEPADVPVEAYLGPLGMTGLTAYTGLLDIGQPRENQTVFVSAASGAVGSAVCQIARIMGCRVVGSAGSDEKIRWLTERAGIDAVINYKRESDLTAALDGACPDGIDVYYDNVGGALLESALEHMNPFGRVVLCGMISVYNATEPPPGPRNLFQAIVKRLTIQGFIVSDHLNRMTDFYADMTRWLLEDRIRWEVTVTDGIENAPNAFIGLFHGENMGKMLVRIGPDAPARLSSADG